MRILLSLKNICAILNKTGIRLLWVMNVRKNMTTFALILCVLFSLCVLTAQFVSGRAVSASGRTGAMTLIIDAGHGGEDGGAVSVSGVAESGINLSIVLKLEGLAGLYGVPTVLTRREDVSLADGSASTLREKKRSDLYNRVDLVNGTENACLLSIHQNNYTNSSVSGAQVFFRSTEESEKWAVLTQGALRNAIDPENDRVAAQIPESVYLMNHVNCPAILVECGFLSNRKEDQLLQQEAYQSGLAATIFSAYLHYYTGEAAI